MTAVLIVALAAFWGWQALNMDGPFTPIRRLLIRLPAGAKLVVCPFCIGGWLSLIGMTVLHAATGELDPVLTPLLGLASAGLVGLAGSFAPVYGEEDF